MWGGVVGATNFIYSAGYGNTTSAINAVQFTVSAGTLEFRYNHRLYGDICLYGIA